MSGIRKKLKRAENGHVYGIEQLRRTKERHELFEAEHELAEVTKEEKKVKSELGEEGERVKHMIDEEFNTLIREEENGVKTYESFIRYHNISSSSPWGAHILKIVSDEREHLRLLKIDQDKMRKSITSLYSK